MRGEKECPLSLVQPLQALTKTSDVVFVFRRDLAPIAKAAASKRLPTERRARRGGGSAHMAQALYMQRKCTPWEVRAVKAEAGRDQAALDRTSSSRNLAATMTAVTSSRCRVMRNHRLCGRS